MGQLRLSVRLYISAVALTTLALLSFTLSTVPSLEPDQVVIAIILSALVATVNLFPLRFAYRSSLSLDTSVVFTAVLLYDPGTAMLIAGAGSLLGDLIRKRFRDLHHGIGFNASQTMLQAGFSGLVLASTGWDSSLLLQQPVWKLLMIVVAAGTMHLVNTLLVATIVSLEIGQSPLSVWKQSAGLISSQQLSEFMLGVLGAVIVTLHSVALPLLLFPALALYHALDRHLQLRNQTMAAVEALADMVDVRDPYTANHSRRVGQYACELARALGLTPDEADLVERAGRVHDIGKMTVDRSVLTKQGTLSEEDWEQLRQHPVTGAEMLSRFPHFALATSYVRSHHERVDGKGYPDGLIGEQIPLGARIIAVADAFDCMTTARPYRAGLPLSVVRSELLKHRGIQWDAHIVDVLLELMEQGQIELPSAGAVPAPRIGIVPGM